MSPATAHRGRGRWALWLTGAAAWSALVVAGFALLWTYEATPGAQQPAPPHWPAASRLRPDPSRPTLVLAIHPHCPCSRATLEELAEIMARCGDRLRTHVLFYYPAGEEEDWAHGGMWERAAAIAGVQIWGDVEGVEGQRFGAATSGHAVLYSAAGERLFSGGITATRGHAGDNAGRRAILAVAGGDSIPGPTNTPVFGCPLCAKQASDTKCSARCPQ